MRKARLCVTVSAPTTAELRQKRDDAFRRGADLVELRLDAVTDVNVAGALAGRQGAVVVTCRPTWEGGHFTGPEDDRHQILAEAVSLGADYVDVEWRAGFDDLVNADRGGKEAGGVIVSYHDFEKIPVDLADLLRTLASTRAAVVKVAAKTDRLSDCVALRDAG